MKKKILITGYTGFIGINLLEYLDKKKISYYCIAKRKAQKKNCYSFNLENIKKYKNKILKLLKNCHTVVHCAALAKDDDEYRTKLYKLNFLSTYYLINYCKIAKVKKFIFISSVRANGNNYQNIISNEKTNIIPEGYYGKTKKMSEKYVSAFGKRNNIETISLRLTNVYGPYSTGYIYKLINFIKKNHFLNLPMIGNFRSFVHVKDVCNLIYLCITKYKLDNSNYIVTYKKPVDSGELFNLIANKLYKKEKKIIVPKLLIKLIIFIVRHFKIFLPDLRKFMSSQYFDNKKLKKKYKWEAKIGLLEGIKTVL